MPLNILIIGRGKAAPVTVINGHILNFEQTAKQESKITSLDDYHFVLHHFGNTETVESVSDWADRGCKGKIIALRGARLSDDDEKLAKRYDIPKLEFIADKQDVLDLKWLSVPGSFEGTSDDLVKLLRPKVLEQICALAILCQGYLAVHASQLNDKWGPDEILPALERMGWTNLEKNSTAINEIFRFDLKEKISVVVKADWWLEPFELKSRPSSKDEKDKWKKFEENLENEWEADKYGPIPESLLNGIFKILKSGDDIQGDFELEDGRKQSMLGLVSNLYCDLAKRIEG